MTYHPTQQNYGGWENTPSCPVGQSVHGAEGQTHSIFSLRHGVADVDGRDGLDEKRDDEVGQTEVGQDEVVGGHLEMVGVADSGDNKEVADDAWEKQYYPKEKQ